MLKERENTPMRTIEFDKQFYNQKNNIFHFKQEP